MGIDFISIKKFNIKSLKGELVLSYLKGDETRRKK
jgi:hypothetical protein